MLRISTCLLIAVGCVLAAPGPSSKIAPELQNKSTANIIVSLSEEPNLPSNRSTPNALKADADTELIQQIAEDDQVESITEEQIAHLIEPVDMKNVEALLTSTNGEWSRFKHLKHGKNWDFEWRGVIIAQWTLDTSTPEPTDNNGHGTHTTGTIAGGKGIGVAPGAKWAACRGCASSACWQSDLLACGDFFACPTRADGSSPDCSKAPNVVSTPGEVVEEIPGSTTIDDAISSFSSVGPTTDGRMKPEVSAPGSNVISAYYTSDTAYVSLSGTSMACPHAAGAIALLQVRDKNLSYVKAKEFLLGQTIRTLYPLEGLAKESLIISSPTTCLVLVVSTPSRVFELKPSQCKANLDFGILISTVQLLFYTNFYINGCKYTMYRNNMYQVNN
ncbi:Bacillopeptidase F [Orchesella cincta]|uniref:Bacillopeptidase F n=1 Tax=Orchesella cincta TaxID=48709 RepID=A0A1D2MNP6_ORCCI|nr:Bacillopeptidase F [Orchesella cincta]